MGDWLKDMGKAASNVGKAISNEAGRVVNEAGRHVTESINDIAKETEKNGFVGGAVAFIDKTSIGNITAGAIDSIIPGADLPPAVVDGISMGVNAFSGGPGAIPAIIDGFQLLGAAGGALGGAGGAKAGAPAAAAAKPTPAQQAAAQDPAATRMQTPESPSTAFERFTGSTVHVDQLRAVAVKDAEANVTSVGGGTVERMGDNTYVIASNGNDTISVERQKDGSVKVSINGESTTLSAKDAENLIILAKDGKDAVNVKGVDGVKVIAGRGDDVVSVEGDNVKVYGGAGKDRVNVDGDNAKVDGGLGRDKLTVSGNNAKVSGGKGVDVITVEGNNATIRGGGSLDIIKGGGRNASIDGGSGKTINKFEDRPPQLSTRDGAAYKGDIADYMKNHPNAGFGGNVGGAGDVNSGFVSNDFITGEISGPKGGRVSGSKDPKLAKLERDLEKATRDIDKILSNPNLSFEDMIFLLMRAVIKQSESEVKIDLQKEKNDRTAASDAKKQIDGKFDGELQGLNKEQEGIAGMAAGPDKDKKQAALNTKKTDFERRKTSAGNDFSEKAEARSEKFEELKEALQKVSEMQQALSNIMNSLHQTAQNAIGNIR